MRISIHLHIGRTWIVAHIDTVSALNTLKVKSNHLICDTFANARKEVKKNVTACLWRSMAQSSNGSNECHSFVLITIFQILPYICSPNEWTNERTSICIEGHDIRLHESIVCIDEFCWSLKWKSCLINSLFLCTLCLVSVRFFDQRTKCKRGA